MKHKTCEQRDARITLLVLLTSCGIVILGALFPIILVVVVLILFVVIIGFLIKEAW